MNMRTLINDLWTFAECPPGTEADILFQNGDNAAKCPLLQPVDLPHDWMITNVKDLYRSSVGLYRRTLTLDASRHNSIFFEGVYMRTTVFLNGQKIFFWPYGYTSFEVDLTPYQRDGENDLLVHVDYRNPNTRWYSGAGIFRDVWLLEKDMIRIPEGGVYVHAEPEGTGSDAFPGTRFHITIDTEAVSSSLEEAECEILHTLRDAEGKAVAASKSRQILHASMSGTETLAVPDPLPGPGPSHETDPKINTQILTIDNAILWDTENPYLYTLETSLACQGTVVDTVTQRIGLRTISFTPDEGFFLNGRHVKIHGVCMHHDLGALGAAFNRKAARRQIEKLKEIGVNSIRTSHNPPAVGLMELADEMGILINSDAFDMWEIPKTENDYGIFFHEWVERDVESWIRRDRNHPSVIMWSCGNEIPDTNNLSATAIAERLVKAVRKHDPRHNAYHTIASNFVAWENAQKIQDVFELSGYNYLESVYDEHHEKFPHWCIYGSETASTVQSRGIYHFPKSNRLLTYEDQQCSSLDNCSTNWGAKSVHRFITDDRDRPFSAGQYIWTGWDYIGEPTPYFSKNSFFGHIDTAGFFKDTAYIIKAGWVPREKDPFVHISPYWDFNPGQMIDVELYSNAPRVALYYAPKVPGDPSSEAAAGSAFSSSEPPAAESVYSSLELPAAERDDAPSASRISASRILVGEKCLDQQHDQDYSAHFRLPYQPGTLYAEAYDSDGNVIATDETCSFHNPVSIRLTPEYGSLKADGEDLQFLQISVLDAFGQEVRNARNRMHVSVSGPARIVGLDNGDSTDYDEYKCNSRKLFSGKLLAILAATRDAGEVTVTVTSPGLTPAELAFPAVPSLARDGISCGYSVSENRVLPGCCAASDAPDTSKACGSKGASVSDPEAEIPIRKLTLTCEPASLVGSTLTQQQPSAVLTARIEPKNASYSDVQFKAVTEDGIESRAVVLEAIPVGDTTSPDRFRCIRMTAVSDGKFRLAATANNGKDHPEILSDLEFSVTGFGSATLDPYTMVHGCEFSESTKESLLSFRGSVNFGDGNVIRFDNIDFGDYGSDELHLSLFSFRNEEPIEIWDGEPEHSELLCSGTYSVPSNYNVLQEDTFQLKKRLRGVRSLTFRFVNGFVLGGFRMTKQEKAYGLLYATEHGMITGDTYVEREDGVYGIGNNVDIEFPGMNFTKGVSAVTITGRTRKADSPIHIRFFAGDNVIKQVVEFPVSEETQTLTFPIEGFSGEGKVNFIFLPGSDFDLISFQFQA